MCVNELTVCHVHISRDGTKWLQNPIVFFLFKSCRFIHLNASRESTHTALLEQIFVYPLVCNIGK
jgi:hypothetical protein